jgi:hypothetical protein
MIAAHAKGCGADELHSNPGATVDTILRKIYPKAVHVGILPGVRRDGRKVDFGLRMV